MPTTHFGRIVEYDQRRGLVFALPFDMSLTGGKRILLPIGNFRLPGVVEDVEPSFMYPAVMPSPVLERGHKRSEVAFQLVEPDPAKGPRAKNWCYRHSWNSAYGEMRRNIMLRVPTGHGEANSWGWRYLGQFAWDEPTFSNPEYRVWQLPFDTDGNRTPGGYWDYWYLPLWRLPSVQLGVVDLVLRVRQEFKFLDGGMDRNGFILQPPQGWYRHQSKEFGATFTAFIDPFGFERVLITENLHLSPYFEIRMGLGKHLCSDICHDPARWMEFD